MEDCIFCKIIKGEIPSNKVYEDEGQRIAAKNYYRPRNEKIAEEYKDTFKDVNLVTIDDVFGGWREAQKKHFADGGVFDRIYGN